MILQVVGIQRIRCYPFRQVGNFQGRTFHGKNQCDVVAMVPLEADLEEWEYKYDGGASVDVARVQLFFEFTLQPGSEDTGLEPVVTRAVFVQHLSAFADALNKPLFRQKQAGARRECTIAKSVCFLHCISCNI